MNAEAFPKAALRPFLPQDTELLAQIFRDSIEELTIEDYDDGQRAAWSAAADDEDAFGQRLAAQLTLIATIAGSPVGFVSVKGPDHIDLLYVHPSVTLCGVASLLCDAVEKLTQARGAKKLTVDASDTAQLFFSKRGFVAQRRQTVACGDEWLGNTHMEKRFDAQATTGVPR
jgi:putative acetyltransferase